MMMLVFNREIMGTPSVVLNLRVDRDSGVSEIDSHKPTLTDVLRVHAFRMV